MHTQDKTKPYFRADEFLKLPEELNAYCQIELLDGEVIVMPKPTPLHNRIVKRLLLILEPYLSQKQMGECFLDTLVLLDPEADVVVAPDLCYFKADTIAISEHDKALKGTPELVVEVLSPSTQAYDRGAKLDLYHHYGVPWVWLLSPAPLEIEEYRWSEEGYQLVQHVRGEERFTPTLFPDLSFSLSALMGR